MGRKEGKEDGKEEGHLEMCRPEPYCKGPDDLFSNMEGLNPRQMSILLRLTPFYQGEIPPLVKDVLKQTSPISLRTLDWLVTNHSKKLNLVCTCEKGAVFNIFQGYKLCLGYYRRRNFDPFRRRNRIQIRIEGSTLPTTVGQLNFLHWAHTNGVLQYAQTHADEIEKDMNASTSAHKQDRKRKMERGLPHKRHELSKAPSSKCSVYKVDSKVSFDVRH